MNTNLLRNLSFHTRRLRLSPFNRSTNSTLSLLSLRAPTTSFFSSQTDPPPFPHTQKKQDPLVVEDISNEELKRRVTRLQEGDAEAIPSVFEAIMQRYLTGKPVEADEELMKEILGKGTAPASSEEDEDDEEEDWDSDSEGMSDVDYEDGDSDHGSKGRTAVELIEKR